MEVMVTRNNSDELMHHGTKGMKWGRRLYQNKDGSLTPLGKKHYNKQAEKLKAEEAKIKAAEKVAKTKARTQAKFDKLDAKKEELEARKKALKGKSDGEGDGKTSSEETVAQKRERLLKSNDPKEIYKDKDVLTDYELQSKLNRMNLENQLYNKIPAETQKTGVDYMNDAKTKIDAASNLYKSIDNAYSSVANSAIGKTLAKNLGIELPKEEKTRESLSDFLKNIDKKSDKEIQDRNQTENNINSLRDKQKQREKQAAKEAEEAKAKSAKATNNDASEANANNKKNQSSDDTKSSNSTEKPKDDGKVYGEGTSKSTIKEQMDNGKKWWNTDGVSDTVDYSSAEVGETYALAIYDRKR